MSVYDAVVGDVSSFSANRDYTIGNTGAVDGDEMDVYAYGAFGGNYLRVKNAGGTLLVSLGDSYSHTHLIRIGGVWVNFDTLKS